MDKIAFFYNLGYEMALEKIAQAGAAGTAGAATAAAPAVSKSMLREIKDIYKALLGIDRGDTKYLENLKKILSQQRLPAKILAPTIPAAALTGLGYGVYRMTRPKSKIEKIRRALGLD